MCDLPFPTYDDDMVGIVHGPSGAHINTRKQYMTDSRTNTPTNSHSSYATGQEGESPRGDTDTPHAGSEPTLNSAKRSDASSMESDKRTHQRKHSDSQGEQLAQTPSADESRYYGHAPQSTTREKVSRVLEAEGGHPLSSSSVPSPQSNNDFSFALNDASHANVTSTSSVGSENKREPRPSDTRNIAEEPVVLPKLHATKRTVPGVAERLPPIESTPLSHTLHQPQLSQPRHGQAQLQHSQPQHQIPVRSYIPFLPPPPPLAPFPPYPPWREHPYSPSIGPHGGQREPLRHLRDYSVSAYGSPLLGSQIGSHPSQLPPRPPPDSSYYMAPPRRLPVGMHGPSVGYNSAVASTPAPGPGLDPASAPEPSTLTHAPLSLAPIESREPDLTNAPGRIEKHGSSSKFSRTGRSRRRRNASRHGESIDARTNSVALITSAHESASSARSGGPQVSEKPPGGYYWAVLADTARSDDDEEGIHEETPEYKRSESSVWLPIQMCQPPLRNAMPAYPQALEADPLPRMRKQSKYSAEQDRLILELKSHGESWAEIASKAHCHNQLAARNRYQVLIGQQGSGTFFWTEEDVAALQSALDEAERAKWIYLAKELSRKRGRRFNLEAVHYKVTQMFAEDPVRFGVIKTRDSNRGGAPYKRKTINQG